MPLEGRPARFVRWALAVIVGRCVWVWVWVCLWVHVGRGGGHRCVDCDRHANITCVIVRERMCAYAHTHVRANIHMLSFRRMYFQFTRVTYMSVSVSASVSASLSVFVSVSLSVSVSVSLSVSVSVCVSGPWWNDGRRTRWGPDGQRSWQG